MNKKQINFPNMAKTHWMIYIIRNRYDELYTGITTDITRRFQQHQLGKGAKALKGKSALLLVLLVPVTSDHKFQSPDQRFRFRPIAHLAFFRDITRRFNLNSMTYSSAYKKVKQGAARVTAIC